MQETVLVVTDWIIFAAHMVFAFQLIRFSVLIDHLYSHSSKAIGMLTAVFVIEGLVHLHHAIDLSRSLQAVLHIALSVALVGLIWRNVSKVLVTRLSADKEARHWLEEH